MDEIDKHYEAWGSTGPQILDMYQPVGKLKVDYDIDNLSHHLKELTTRFKEINFDSVLDAAEDLRNAGVTDTTPKSPNASRRPRTKTMYETLGPVPEGSSHRAAAMLSMHSKVVRETPAARQNKRVSDLRLPPMPKAADEILHVPNGINEWACLQDAVNQVSKEKFHTQNAQLGWRKWAMIHTNANVMVDIFWWLAATFFCKDDPIAPSLREFLYHRLSRHFIKLLIDATEEGVSGSFTSKLRDNYQRNFIHMTALAACKLFCAAVPRSAPLFDDQFMAAVMQQLRIWTSGLLPADSSQARTALQGPSALASTKSNRVQEPAWKSLRRGNKGKGASGSGDAIEGQVSEETSELPRLRGKAAQGGFDIAKTSPFVMHFLDHHDLEPNDLKRGLLGRYVCAAIKREELANVSTEDGEIEKCAAFAKQHVQATTKARQNYKRQAKHAVAATEKERRRLQHELRGIQFRSQVVCKGTETRKMSNKLANWVEFSKETAEQNEADRRDPQVPEDAAAPRAMHGRRAMPGRLKDGIDIQAHVHSEMNKTTRSEGYTRYTTGTVNVRIARKAKKALDYVRSAYGDPTPKSFGQ